MAQETVLGHRGNKETKPLWEKHQSEERWMTSQRDRINRESSKGEIRDEKLLIIASILAGVVVLLGASTAQAITIGFVPQNQIVDLNDAVSVDIVVSGLEANGLDEIVSAFDLDITYNMGIVGLTSVTFGSELGFSFQDDFSALGTVDIAEASLEADATLQGGQGNSVTLGTLNFSAIGAGTTSLAFVFDQFNQIDGLNADILAITSDNGTITVRDPNSPVVPEPSTILLFGTGLVALGGRMLWRRRQS